MYGCSRPHRQPVGSVRQFARPVRPRSRSLLLRIVALLVCLPWLAVGCAGTQNDKGVRTPVVVIALDTLRADHVSCCGGPPGLTPNIDALAGDGVLFRTARATAPWTLPSFATMFTGLPPHEHGAVGGEYRRLADERTTLAERLDAEGYATAGYVSINYLTAETGMHQGCNATRLYGSIDGLDQAEAITHLGVYFLADRRAEPFFLFLHYFGPHAPYEPPADWLARHYDGDPRASGEPVLDLMLSDANGARQKDGGMYDWLEGVTDPGYAPAAYRAEVAYVDDHVGRVIARLRELGLYDEALVVLVADHGEHMGEHGIWYSHTEPYDETLRVPWIVKLPGGRLAGRVVDDAVSLLDFLPTVLDAVGLPAADELPGCSLLPLAAGADDASRSPSLAETGSVETLFTKSLLDGDLKLLCFRTGDEVRYELFDLAADPGETVDIAARRPDDLARLRRRLWSLCDPEHPVVAGPASRPIVIDVAGERRLRSLGY